MVFVFDLDGTLLLKNYKISKNMVEVINKLDKKGHTVIFASGRMLVSIRKIISKHFERDFPIVAYNGAIVWYPKENIIFETGLDFDTSAKIIKFLRSRRIHRQVYVKDKLYSEEDNEEIKMYARHADVSYYLCDDLLELIKGEKTTKILAIGDPDVLNEAKEIINDFNLKVNVFKSMANFLDVVPLGINKAVALKVLLKKVGLSGEKIIAFGDNHNDVPLFEIASVGVAVKNAVHELKEVADYVVPSSEEDGVYSFFVNFFSELVN